MVVILGSDRDSSGSLAGEGRLLETCLQRGYHGRVTSLSQLFLFPGHFEVSSFIAVHHMLPAMMVYFTTGPEAIGMGHLPHMFPCLGTFFPKLTSSITALFLTPLHPPSHCTSQGSIPNFSLSGQGPLGSAGPHLHGPHHLIDYSVAPLQTIATLRHRHCSSFVLINF